MTRLWDRVNITVDSVITVHTSSILLSWPPVQLVVPVISPSSDPHIQLTLGLAPAAHFQSFIHNCDNEYYNLPNPTIALRA